MHFEVSTKVESAWYVDPDLLADEEETPAPGIESADGQRPNETMALVPEDLEDAGDALGLETELFRSGARHYRRVSLKGALLAQDESESFSLSLRRGWPLFSGFDWRAKIDRVKGRLRHTAFRFERGHISPAHLAIFSFFAGVGTTLLGVLIAL